MLSKIVEEKRRAIEAAKRALSLEEIRKRLTPRSAPRFKEALTRTPGLALIAEVKQASPSRGVLCRDFDPVRIALGYAEAGARALSVLTEEKFFLGSPSHLSAIKKAVDLPVLRKDFILEEYQVFESALLGADAVLLIAGLLSEEEITRLRKLALLLGMDALVEVHHKEELEKALRCGADLVGINNRDLRTFQVDLAVTERLMPLVPKDRVVVSESGIQSRQDISRLRQLGVHAVLIGEAFLTSPDPARKIRELMV